MNIKLPRILKIRRTALNAETETATNVLVPDSSMSFNAVPRDDGGMEILRLGLFPNPDPKIGIQKIEMSDLQAVNAWIAEQAAKPDWTGIQYQVGHGWDVPATAWAKNAVIEGESLIAFPEHNADGETIHAQKTYKSISPALNGYKDADGFFRPDSIEHIAYTNRPVMKELRPAVNAAGAPAGSISQEERSRSGSSSAPASGPSSLNAALPAAGDWKENLLAIIREVLGDAENAPDAINRCDALISKQYAVIENLEAIWRLVWNLGYAVDQTGSIAQDPESFDVQVAQEILDTAATAANSLKQAETDRDAAMTAFRALAVNCAVAVGKVADTPAERGAAAELMAANSEQACRLFFGTPDPAAVKLTAANTAPVRSVTPLPRSPLTARNTVSSAIPGGAAPKTMTAHNAAVKQLQESEGITFGEAHSRYWQKQKEA